MVSEYLVGEPPMAKERGHKLLGPGSVFPERIPTEKLNSVVSTKDKDMSRAIFHSRAVHQREWFPSVIKGRFLVPNIVRRKIFPDIAFNEYPVRTGTSSSYQIKGFLSAVMLIDKATSLRDKRTRARGEFLELTRTDIQPEKTIRSILGTYNINITFVVFRGIRDKTFRKVAEPIDLKGIKGAADCEYLPGATVRVHSTDAVHSLAVTGRTSITKRYRKANSFNFSAG